jgi:hypothetical protein
VHNGNVLEMCLPEDIVIFSVVVEASSKCPETYIQKISIEQKKKFQF